MKKIKVVNLKYSKYDVYIGRENPEKGLSASKWQNPFKIGQDGSRKEVLRKYFFHVVNSPELMSSLNELRGKTLGCYCKNQAGKGKRCHGDVLKELIEGNFLFI